MHKPYKILPSEYPKIVSLYKAGKSTITLGKLYNVNAGAIYYIIKKSGVVPRTKKETQRKYKIRECFFDVIDTQDKAYILGLLFADGCNSTERNQIRIILSEKDRDLLTQISEIVYYQPKPLLFQKGKTFVDNQKIYQRKNSCVFSIISKHISNVLVEYGLVKNKSLILEFPNKIPEYLISHFIRGYFDGDGSIHLRKKDTQPQVCICGTQSFLNTIKTILLHININSAIYPTKKIYTLYFNGRKQANRFYEWLYADASLYLERKKCLFEQSALLLSK